MMYKFLSLAFIGLLGTLLVASDVHAQITPAQIPLKITTPAAGATVAPAATVTIKGTGKKNAGLILEVRLIRMAAVVGLKTYNQNIDANGNWERIVTFPNGVTLQDGDMLTVGAGTSTTGEYVDGTWQVKP